MKKLNRKGFTLVELLAVIIILAIVVGITIPAVLTTINSTRDKAFQTSVEAVADWLDRQASAFLVSDGDIVTTDGTYVSACTTNGAINATCTVSAELLNAAGVKAANFTTTDNSSSIKYNTTSGRYCVKLKGSTSGDYQSDAIKNSSTCTE